MGACEAGNEQLDEQLESIWTCHEKGQTSVADCLANAHAETDRADLEELVERGLITLEDERVVFTEPGRECAASIIRRHRLAERLLVDVLGMTAEESERFACTFEHSVVPEVTDGICTLLGHPRECPHGRPIPRGRDCESGRTEVPSALRPLSEVPIGHTVKVAYLRATDHDRLHQLLSLGFTPGIPLRVHQRTPVLVVQMDQSEFALDSQVAGDIYVWTEAG